MSSTAEQFSAIMLVSGLLLGLLCPSGALAEPAATPRLTPVVRAVQKVLPSVVNIATEQVVRVADPFEASFNEFFGPTVHYYRKSIPLGSGVVVDPGGLVLTNYHVVKRASNIEVRLLSGQSVTGVPIAFDEGKDLALLDITAKMAPASLDAVEFARPDDLLLGETVVAVGNPFGLAHSVTTGVLSATNRSIREGGITFNDVLQTDAAINPGNSGGPLINLDGQLIGLSLSIRREAEGIGFGIPLRRIEDVLSRWLVPAQFCQGTCGFVPRTQVAGTDVRVVAETVDPSGPAARAGLESQDVLLSLNGTATARALDMARLLWRLRIDDAVSLDVEGKGTIAFAVAEMTSDQLIRRRLRLQVQELTGPLREALGLPPSVHGLAISEVLPGSDFAHAKVRRGDILYGVGNSTVTDISQLDDLLRDRSPGQSMDVLLISTAAFRGELFLKRFPMRVIVR